MLGPDGERIDAEMEKLKQQMLELQKLKAQKEREKLQQDSANRLMEGLFSMSYFHQP